MNEPAPEQKIDEQKLVRTYMDLTGTPEATARSVLMFVVPEQKVEPVPDVGSQTAQAPGRNGLAQVFFALALLAGAWTGPAARAAPTSAVTDAQQLPFGSPVSLADAVDLALQKNPNILRAQKDLEAAQGIIIQTRAIVIPKVVTTGTYAAAEGSDVDTFQTPGITFGTEQNWTAQIRLVQSLYEGGRLASSLRVARLTKKESVLNYQTTVADTVRDVELAYYDVLLAEQEIAVQEASVELLTRELTDTTRRFDAGTVPRFNVLRAEVELANARPRLIRARNSLRLAKNNLVDLLGFNVPTGTFENIPLMLSGRLDAEPYDLDLPRAVSLALQRRTELEALRAARSLRQEDLVASKAGYKPSLQGYVGYDMHNSMLSQNITYELHGWIAGAQVTWSLFDGLLTQGRVKQAAANFERASVDLDDSARRIELEVRTAHSNFVEAREVLESQQKAVAEAEEALRLASARSEAGTGTQLDVLSAQTALTEARTTQIQALHDYDAARARLQRAVGTNLPQTR